MYIPKIFAFDNKEQILEFMRKYSFATIISSTPDKLLASHLPFSIDVINESVFLSAHFAKNNEQWKFLDERTFVIFSEPHAYISPKNYELTESVPTWDYISIHAYGTPEIIEDEKTGFKLLEKMIHNYEPEYLNQWSQLSDSYKNKMYHGIVLFQFKITDLRANKKLSQNKSLLEKERIIKTLSNSPNSQEQVIADFMKEDITIITDKK